MLILHILLAALQGTPPVCYDGTVGAGPRMRRVVLEVQSQGSATLHFYGRPVRQTPLARATGSNRLSSADGRTSVVLEPPRGGSTAAASVLMVGSRDTLQGTLQPAIPIPGAESMVGKWSGALGPGGVIRLGARLSAGPCGLLVGLFDSPDQGQRDLPMTAIAQRGDSLALDAAYLNLRVSLPLQGGEERRGTMTQPGFESEIVVRRGSALLTRRRPQEPERPFPYGEREVRVASRAPGIALFGTLTLPPTPGPHPAIVMISGSGAQDRDETVAGHRPFLVLSDHLTRLGYAVLRMDDRGVGRSNGNVLQSGLQDIAADVAGALDHLRALPEIDRARIGLLGHSEGGYVAPIVAADDPSVAFLLLLAAPGARGRDLLLAQRSALVRASGESPRQTRVDSLLIAQIFGALDARPDDHRLADAVDSVVSRWMRSLDNENRVVAEGILSARTAARDSAGIELWKSAWFKSIYHHDPAAALRRVAVPTYVVIGELDAQVPPAQSLPAFEALFGGGRRHLLTLFRPPLVNHMLQTATTGLMEEYLQIEETIAPVVLSGITDWLARNAPVIPPTPLAPPPDPGAW